MIYSREIKISRFNLITNNRALIVMSLCSTFLFYKYILQNFPSVMAPQLMETFHLKGLGLGVLSGVYFWTYLIVPLFVGIILDQYGTRWITASALMCCAAGMFVFSTAEQMNAAILGRAIIGIGVSFATVSYLKLASVWFKKEYYALLTALLVVAAMIGAICGQMPLAWLIHREGWRTSLSELAWIGVLLAGLFVVFVRDQPHVTSKGSDIKDNSSVTQSLSHNLMLIIKSKQNWLLTGYSGLAFAPVVIFCGLWGNPFLQTAYHLDKIIAPSLISLVFVGLGIGSPLFAVFANKVRNRCAFMLYSTLLSAASISLVIYAHPMPIGILGGLLFLFGFSLGAFSIVFVIGKESNPLYLAGTTIALINASEAFLDALTEPAIGKLLDSFGQMNHTHEFSLSSYHIALAILPIYQIIGACLLIWVKDPKSTGHS